MGEKFKGKRLINLFSGQKITAPTTNVVRPDVPNSTSLIFFPQVYHSQVAVKKQRESVLALSYNKLPAVIQEFVEQNPDTLAEMKLKLKDDTIIWKRFQNVGGRIDSSTVVELARGVTSEPAPGQDADMLSYVVVMPGVEKMDST